MSRNSAAISKYREIVDELLAATGAVQALERRRADVSHRLAQLHATRERVPKPRVYIGGPAEVVDTTKLDRELTQARDEAARLQGAAESLQQRRDVASSIACRCRDLLVERGLLHSSDSGF